MKSYTNHSYFKSTNTEESPNQLSTLSILQSESPTVYILATGGTIAGTAASAISPLYEASQLNIENVIDSVPDIKSLGEKIKAIDLFHVNSEDITQAHWLTIAKKVNELLQNEFVKGVVLTHGTDTLEETAYFLDLVIKSDKPVVLVAAMRPSTSLSSDGPINLYNAIALARSPKAVGQGVLVMMNDTIFDGRNVTKRNTTQVDTFGAPNSGPIGHVQYGEVSFHHCVTRCNTAKTRFDVSDLTVLPTVEILCEYAGSTGKVLSAVIEQKPDGIVIAGVGNGNLAAADAKQLQRARELGIKIVRSSRTGSGYVTETQNDIRDGLIAGDNLNPQKARILLMLSLSQQPKLVEEIRKDFKLY